MRPTLILGLGNPLQSDDGVGCRVIQELEQRALPDDVEVMEGGTPGIGLVELLQGRARVIIVDAAEMGKLPGESVVFQPDDAVFRQPAVWFSLHDAGVASALALARALNLSLPPMTIIGVQPARMDWGQDLSPKVRAAVPRVVETIRSELCQKKKF